jgi:hypothetical protein
MTERPQRSGPATARTKRTSTIRIRGLIGLAAAAAVLATPLQIGGAATGAPAASGRSEIVLDNADATVTGNWKTGRGPAGQYGDDYLWRAANSGNAAVTWRPTIPADGRYGVYYQLPDGAPDHASAALFTIRDSSGSRDFPVDERASVGGGWVHLADADLKAGTHGAVSVAADGRGKVVADAVKFVPLGSVADPLPDPGLQDLISDAITSGAHDLRIPAGTYAVSSTEHSNGALLNFDGANDLTVDATGVTIVGKELTRAVNVVNSHNLTIEGLTVDYDPLPFTQGAVYGIAPDLSWLDVTLDAGYPQRAYSRISIYDPTTGFQKAGINHLWGTTAAFVQPGVVRVSLAGIGNNVALGDPITLAGDPTGTAHAISFEQSSGSKLRDVTVHTAAGFGLIDTSGDGGTVLDGFHLVPGPPPPGATKAPLLSAIWDGIQFQAVGHGPTMINSEVRNAGDDSFSIQTKSLPVLESSGNKLTVGFTDPWRAAALQVGDRLERFRDGPSTRVTGIRKVAYSDLTLDPATQAKFDQGQTNGSDPWYIDKNSIFELTVDTPEIVPAGQVVFDPDRMGNGFVFKNNTIHSPGRGMLLKAGDGVIEDNVFEGGDKAIMLAPENATDSHGGAAYDLTIRGNVFRHTGYHHDMPWSDQAGAIGMAGGNVTSERTFDNIVIDGNLFDSIRGLNLNVSDASNVTVSNNTFRNTHTTENGTNGASYSIPADTVIYVAKADGVAFTHNVVEGIGPYGTSAIVVAPTASGVTGADDIAVTAASD